MKKSRASVSLYSKRLRSRSFLEKQVQRERARGDLYHMMLTQLLEGSPCDDDWLKYLIEYVKTDGQGSRHARIEADPYTKQLGVVFSMKEIKL